MGGEAMAGNTRRPSLTHLDSSSPVSALFSGNLPSIFIKPFSLTDDLSHSLNVTVPGGGSILVRAGKQADCGWVLELIGDRTV
ncbi:hypothetical protein BJX96DRAFT_36441 [Aspergillus floccosus]